MFDDLRAAFREAIEAFNQELSRDQVPETMDRLIQGMVVEVTDAKALVAELEGQIEKADKAAEIEQKHAETSLRRQEMAQKIDDEETAKVAGEFAAKHAARLQVLERKAEALRAELSLRRQEVDQMMSKVKEAQTQRASLTATTGRTGARESMTEADRLFDELDRMAGKIDGTQNDADAAEAMSDVNEFDPLDTRIDAREPEREEIDFDAALEELKRRMGKS